MKKLMAAAVLAAVMIVVVSQLLPGTVAEALDRLPWVSGTMR